MMKIALQHCDLFPETHNPSLIIRKHQTNPIWGTLYKIPVYSTLYNCQGYEKQGKIKKLKEHSILRRQDKSNLKSWIGLSNTKKALMELLVKYKIKFVVQVTVIILSYKC